jgi:hypothetical protein
MFDDSPGRVPGRRSIAASLLLSILTCGIYGLVWDYRMGREIREHTRRLDINPGVDVFFMVITCNIYYFFWVYKVARILRRQDRACFPSQPPITVPWLLVVFAVLGATLVSDAVLQHDMNRHWQRHGG